MKSRHMLLFLKDAQSSPVELPLDFDRDCIDDLRFHRAPRKLLDDYTECYEVLGSGCSGPVRTFSGMKFPEVRYAVKRLRPNATMSREMVKAEVQNHLMVDCPHIARLFDVYESSDNIAMVMECLEGGTLHHRLKERKFFLEPDAKFAMQQVLSSIEYLHSNGLVHCDVKLDNFVYDRRGSDNLKLVDFGFSQRWDAASDETLDECIGTLAFVAPEVLYGGYTSQCDLWSVGVVAYMLLSGTSPFTSHGTTAFQRKRICTGSYRMDSQQWSDISTHGKEFIQVLVEVDPRKRFTAKEALVHPWLEAVIKVRAVGRHRRAYSSTSTYCAGSSEDSCDSSGYSSSGSA